MSLLRFSWLRNIIHKIMIHIIYISISNFKVLFYFLKQLLTWKSSTRFVSVGSYDLSTGVKAYGNILDFFFPSSDTHALVLVRIFTSTKVIRLCYWILWKVAIWCENKFQSRGWTLGHSGTVTCTSARLVGTHEEDSNIINIDAVFQDFG